MDFIHYDLGYLEAGTTVAVYLNSAANVSVLDSVNFSSYRIGCSFRYFGGYVTRSPYYVTIPNSGRWHVAIDLGGYGGSIGSSVKIIPPERNEASFTFMGYPAKQYPNRKKPNQFTDILFGGRNGEPDGPGHGHAIIENSSGDVVFLREPNSSEPTMWDQERCP